MSTAAAFDPAMAVALMSAAADPKAFQDRMTKLQTAMAEYKAVKAEALRLKTESEKIAKETASAMTELVTARAEQASQITKAEQALIMRVQACDDRERDMARREEVHKAERAKLSSDINDHARYRERDKVAHEIKLAEVIKREGLITERERAAEEAEATVAEWVKKVAPLAGALFSHLGIVLPGGVPEARGKA